MEFLKRMLTVVSLLQCHSITASVLQFHAFPRPGRAGSSHTMRSPQYLKFRPSRLATDTSVKVGDLPRELGTEIRTTAQCEALTLALAIR